MDEDRIGLVLARISELRVEITNCIHKASKKDEVESGNGEDPDEKTHEGDDEAVDCLLKIKDALESLEAQVSSLQALQEQQWYEKEAALAEIGYSQEKLLQTLKGYEGKDYQVIHEAIAFVSETVEDNNDLLLPPYPSRPSRTLVSDKGYGVHLPSARKLTQNGVTGSHNHNSRKDVDDANHERSEPKSPLRMVKFFLSAAAKTALTVVGVISVLTLAGFEPQIKKRDNQINVSNLFQQVANSKVPVVENGETQCVVKERVEIPFESVVATPDVNANCTCEPQDNKYNHQTKHKALSYKLIAISSILCSSALGVILPILLKNFKSLQKNDYSPLQFMIKAFAAGVILATGFIHILPDAFESLTSPCLSEDLWGSFPFAGFVAMMSAIFTLMMESFASGYHRRAELRKAQPVNIGDEQGQDEHIDHGPQILLERSDSSSLMRHRLISQVLELGILVHSVIIGISLGTTENPKTIKPLIIALSFHQFFEGMGLGGCISQAKYKVRTIIIMVLFFTVTTPSGIAIGMMISKGYNEQSSTALIVQGVLNSASAGILIYMALVDLLATDFMNPKLYTSFKLQIVANVSLILGACCMSLLAKWGGT